MTLEPFMATNLSVKHGFFTRQGGVSTGIYESLNCGRGAKDDPPENVGRNRARIMEHLDLPFDKLVTVHQVHSATAVLIRSVTMPGVEADAMVTKEPGLALGILTADCTPVLFCDAQAGVIGAAHAGWRGAVGGILQATLDLMQSEGAKLSNIHAAIGPTIHQDNYEVDQDFFDKQTYTDAGITKFFKPSHRPDHHLFDLPGFVAQTLNRAGVTNVEAIPQCTYANEDQFFSYRRNTHQKLDDYGRQLSVIAL